MKPWRDDATPRPRRRWDRLSRRAGGRARLGRWAAPPRRPGPRPRRTASARPRHGRRSDRRDRRRGSRRNGPGRGDQPGRLAGHRGRQPRRRPARPVPRASSRAPAPSSSRSPSSTRSSWRSWPSPTTPSRPSWSRCASTAARPSSTRAACSAPRCSSRPSRAGSQIGAFHPLVSFTADVERSVAALQGATIALEGDDRLIGLLADLAEAIGGRAGPAAPRHQGRLPRRGRARLRRSRGPARRHRRRSAPRPASTSGAPWPSTAGSSSRRSPTPEALAWPPPSPARSPAAMSARSRPISTALSRLAPGRRGALPRRRPARGTDRRGAARPVTGAAGARPARACKGWLTGYDWPHAAQHRGEVRGVAGGPLRPPCRPRVGAAARASLRASRSSGPPRAGPSCAPLTAACGSPAGVPSPPLAGAPLGAAWFEPPSRSTGPASGGRKPTAGRASPPAPWRG